MKKISTISFSEKYPTQICLCGECIIPAPRYRDPRFDLGDRVGSFRAFIWFSRHLCGIWQALNCSPLSYKEAFVRFQRDFAAFTSFAPRMADCFAHSLSWNVSQAEKPFKYAGNAVGI